LFVAAMGRWNMTAAPSAFEAVRFSWAAKAAPASVILGWTRRSLANRLLIRPAPVQDLLLCAKHLFVAPMMAWVHPDCRESTNQVQSRGSPRSRGTWGRRPKPDAPNPCGCHSRTEASGRKERGQPSSSNLQQPVAGGRELIFGHPRSLRPVRGVSESRAAISHQEAVT
jgi:hypothetical protein